MKACFQWSGRYFCSGLMAAVRAAAPGLPISRVRYGGKDPQARPTFAWGSRKVSQPCWRPPTSAFHRRPFLRATSTSSPAWPWPAPASLRTLLRRAPTNTRSCAPSSRPMLMPHASVRMAAGMAASLSWGQAVSAGRSSTVACTASVVGASPFPTRAAVPGSAARQPVVFCGHTTVAYPGADCWRLCTSGSVAIPTRSCAGWARCGHATSPASPRSF